MTRHTVPPEAAGLRFDVWLSRLHPELSRSRIQTLIRSGHATLNNRTVKPHAKLTAGATVTLEIPPAEPVSLRPEPLPLDVRYEDADLLVVNKPAGLVVHPAAGHASGTLVNALLAHCPDLAGIGGELRPGLVHRLDRDTSGLLVVAKNQTAMRQLVVQFKQRTVTKEYLALVWGTPVPRTGRIETMIGRNPRNRKKMCTRPAAGRVAVTHYETVEQFAGTALLRVRIETGRTHQIRVHLAHLGHPVVGDKQYGRTRGRRLPLPAPRQMLHAARLAFRHPRTDMELCFTAPLPEDMAGLLAALRNPPDRGGTTAT